jgi:hypothetical protein
MPRTETSEQSASDSYSNGMDILDVVLLCHEALAQDSPELPSVYLNQILKIMFDYLSSDQRKEVEVYLAKQHNINIPNENDYHS